MSELGRMRFRRPPRRRSRGLPARQRTGSLPRGSEPPVWFPYYDGRLIATAATSANFFTGLSATQTDVYTNFDLANQFADPFDWYGIAVQPGYTTSLADFGNLVKDATLFVSLSDKFVLQCPIIFLGGGGGVFGESTEATTSVVSIGMPLPDNFFKLRNVVTCKKGETFKAQIKWGAAITLVASTRLWIILYGESARRPM